VLPLKSWGLDGVRLAVAAVGAGIVAWGLSQGINWPVDLVGRLLQVGLSASLGLLLFIVLGQAFAVQEVREISQSLSRRFIRR
jgi:putative peptidoglycan lipid II flippase